MLKPDRPRFNGNPAPATPSTKSGDSPIEPPGADQVAAARKFVDQVGGIERARGTLELLAILADTGKVNPAR